MISTVFVAVALIMTPVGPQAVAFNQVFPTKEACDTWRQDADKKMPPNSVIHSQCVVLGDSF